MVNQYVRVATLLAFIVAPVGAVDFNTAASDVKGIVAQAKENVSKDATDLKPIKIQRRTERDCVHFRFKPDGPEKSDAVWLRSTEYREDCYYQGDPRHGGSRVCHEVPGFTYRERVQVTLENRQKLFPWEDEIFEVCLDGNWLSSYATQVSHKYSADRRGGDYTMHAGARIPGLHDRHGLTARVSYPGNGAKAEFTDKWASYYPGEQIRIKAKLRRNINNWPDSTLGTKEITVSTAEMYTIDFSEFAKKLRSGKKYYVEYGFERIGKVSKQKYLKTGDSADFPYNKSVAPMAFAF